MTLFLGNCGGRQRTRRDTNTISYMPLTPGCQIRDVSARTEISSWPAAASVLNTANIAASTSGPVSVRRFQSYPHSSQRQPEVYPAALYGHVLVGLWVPVRADEALHGVGVAAPAAVLEPRLRYPHQGVPGQVLLVVGDDETLVRRSRVGLRSRRSVPPDSPAPVRAEHVPALADRGHSDGHQHASTARKRSGESPSTASATSGRPSGSPSNTRSRS